VVGVNLRSIVKAFKIGIFIILLIAGVFWTISKMFLGLEPDDDVKRKIVVSRLRIFSSKLDKREVFVDSGHILFFADLRDSEGILRFGWLAPDFSRNQGLLYYWAEEVHTGSDGEPGYSPLIWTTLDDDSYILRFNGVVEVTKPNLLKDEIERLTASGTLRGIRSALTDPNGGINFR
jgi:hypothetical protein